MNYKCPIGCNSIAFEHACMQYDTFDIVTCQKSFTQPEFDYLSNHIRAHETAKSLLEWLLE